MNKKIIFKSILIVIWLIVIFAFSNVDGNNSTSKSKQIIKDAAVNVINIKNTISTKKTEVTPNLLTKIANKLNYPFRKLMHISEYFVLAMLIIFLLKELNMKDIDIYTIVLISCIICASLDEMHQLYVGRTGVYSDVLIDQLGTIICLLIYKYQKHLGKKKART